MNREHASAWASAPGLFSLPKQTLSAQLQKYLHTQGGKEGGEGSRAISLSSTISLCQLTPFMEFQLSPDNRALCQIDSPPPDLDWENTVVSVYQR